VELIGPYLVACLLLAAAGLAKAARPGDTARAVAATVPLRLARVATVVRVVAGAEAIVGLAGLVQPAPSTAGLVAISYLGFAVFVAVARARGGPLASCGCFGTPDTPATRLHIVVDLVLSASAATVAATVTAGWLPPLLVDQPWHGVPLVGVSLLGAWFAYLALGRLSVLGAARRSLGIERRPA
jgi:hypothetical protein